MIYFLSDLHLSPATPAIARRFQELLDGPARGADAVYILGDLFEAWAGDDDLGDPFNAGIVASLRALADSGVELGLLHGNRDFLLGEQFASASGAKFLADPTVLSLPTWQLILSHGDLLCSDDLAYQQFRSEVRSEAWRQAFLARPLAERKAIIAALRQQSEQNKQEKTASLMDVNIGTTDDFLREYGYATLIHGHTHRPARHDHIVDGIHCERWVLGDWHEDAQGTVHGDYLTWDGEQLSRHPL